MVTATFIFQQVSSDADFDSLNNRIKTTAESSPGYLGRKAWSDGKGTEAVVYYWSTMDDLESFRKDATHRLAKSRYREWYAGYRVEIAEVTQVRQDDLFLDWPAPDS